jgi:Asp-tRNA(Asn)/Glu-tRNA(Gln) amidotransferase A subunit family amidase
MTEPYQLTLGQMAQAIRAGSLTSEALVSSCLERVAQVDPAVLAWASLDINAALARAQQLDKESPRSLLHGIPIGVKDIIDTTDFVTSYNSPIYQTHQPATNARIVTRALDAGAIVLGKTTTQEFATRGNVSPTRNPYSTLHSPGGSSSGSAAAVGASMVPLALSSQTAGSIVRPASYCGVVGFKASYGLIDISGVKRMSPTLDTLGWHTRSVQDAAIALSLLSNWQGLQKFESGFTGELLVGICKDPFWPLAEPATRDALSLACERLERAGIRVIDIRLPSGFEKLGTALDVIGDVEGLVSLEHEWLHHRDGLSAGVQEKLQRAQTIKPEVYEQAKRLARTCGEQSASLFAGATCILTPSSPGYAPLLELIDPGDSCFSKLWTILGMPSVSIPVPLPGPLPIGLEVICPTGQDTLALQAAQRIAEILKQKI